MRKGIVGILTKQGESKYIPDVYHVECLKHNLLSIGQLIQKGYRVYIEDYHCVIKGKRPSNHLIAKVSMTSNRLFPLIIVPGMKGKTNTRVVFKEESKEVVEYLDKRENDNVYFQAAFQTKVQDESWLWHFRSGHLKFGGMKLLQKIMSHTPYLQKHFMFEKTLCFNFIIKFVIIDQVGSRIIVFNYAKYFIN